MIFVVIADGFDEVLQVIFIVIFKPNVIYAQAERCRFGVVAEYSCSTLDMVITILFLNLHS